MVPMGLEDDNGEPIAFGAMNSRCWIPAKEAIPASMLGTKQRTDFPTGGWPGAAQLLGSEWSSYLSSICFKTHLLDSICLFVYVYLSLQGDFY